MTSVQGDWRDLELWHLLQSRSSEDDPVREVLSKSMRVIVPILSSGGTAPPDFTLHDDSHAYRVAKRMAELLPDETKTSIGRFELALLLLAAYLHDIGMTPKREVVQRHYKYLRSAENGLLTSREVGELQAWLDEEWDSIDLPIEDRATPDRISLVDEILAYYCRFKHNDWSEAWIREHTALFSPALYYTFLDDLVSLCRSHHEDLQSLRDARYDAKIASSTETVNLRYLAALLRVADVLEIDPERTPEVILEHRNISPGSLLYWLKDHSIAIQLSKGERSQIYFTSRPYSARLFKAVSDTRDAIDEELDTCHTLENEGAFQRGNVLRDRVNYLWPWLPRLTVDLKPADDSFQYIDGTFRPDGRRVLRLITGTALYDHPIVAVREMLQNAADAVTEQIAYERLSTGDHVSSTDALSSAHSVVLSIRQIDGRWHLCCADTGAGMSRQIIEDYFLVSGMSRRPDVKRLSRECTRRGFELERTGQFGIGVLSYFMLGDNLRVLTRRSQEAGDEGGVDGWCFETGGPESFGELRRRARATHGTRIDLRLRTEILRDGIGEWLSGLVDFVKRTVIHFPCILKVVGEDGTILASGGPGWFMTPNQVLESEDAWLDIDQEVMRRNEPLLPRHIRAQREVVRDKWLTYRERARQRIRWFGPIEGRGLSVRGKWRAYLPYFDVNGIKSLVYLDSTEGRFNFTPMGSFGARMLLPRRISTKGFGTLVSQADGKPDTTKRALLYELVLEDEEKHRLNINRSHIVMEPDDFPRFLEELIGVERSVNEGFLARTRDSLFCSINRAFVLQHFPQAAVPDIDMGHGALLRRVAGNQLSLGPCQTPIINLPPEVPVTRALFGEVPLNVSVSIPLGSQNYVNPFRRVGGGKLAFIRTGEKQDFIIPTVVWLSPHLPTTTPTTMAEFPKEWEQVASIERQVAGSYLPGTVWNNSHPVVKAVTMEAWEWAGRLSAEDPREFFDQILESREKSAAWLMHVISGHVDNLSLRWEALMEEHEEDLGKILEKAFGGNVTPLRSWSEHRLSMMKLGGSVVLSTRLAGVMPSAAQEDGLHFVDGAVLPWACGAEVSLET